MVFTTWLLGYDQTCWDSLRTTHDHLWSRWINGGSWWSITIALYLIGLINDVYDQVNDWEQVDDVWVMAVPDGSPCGTPLCLSASKPRRVRKALLTSSKAPRTSAGSWADLLTNPCFLVKDGLNVDDPVGVDREGGILSSCSSWSIQLSDQVREATSWGEHSPNNNWLGTW